MRWSESRGLLPFSPSTMTNNQMIIHINNHGNLKIKLPNNKKRIIKTLILNE